jgi:hypothetical protein
MLGTEGGAARFMTRHRLPKALTPALVALALLPAQAQAAPTWATVNVCQGKQVGVRASMPGDGTTAAMQARFSLQWWSPLRGDWVGVPGKAQSPWLDAGPARYEWAQEGWTFALSTLPPGTRMRGVAELRWISGGRVLRSQTLITRAGTGTPLSLASCQPR